MLGNGLEMLGNGLKMLGNGLKMLGNELEMLGNGPTNSADELANNRYSINTYCTATGDVQ